MELALQHTKENSGFREYLNSSKDNMFVFDLSKYSVDINLIKVHRL